MCKIMRNVTCDTHATSSNRFAQQGVRAIRPIAPLFSSPIDVERRNHRVDDNDSDGDDASLHILSFASIYMIFGQ